MTSSGKGEGYNYSKIVVAAGDKGLPGGSPTDFKIDLGLNMQKIKRVSLSSITFPNNAYNVNSSGGGTNNDFAFTSGATTYEFQLNPGFYTTSALMTAVQTAIQGILTGLGAGQTFSITQDPLSEKVLIAYTAGTGPGTITIEDAARGAGAWELLGFRVGTPIVIGSLPVTATNLPNLGGLKEVYLQSSALAPGNAFDANVQRNILVCIPINVVFGTSNVWECKVDELCELTYKSSRSLAIVDFTLTDRKGIVVDLHGGNLTINMKVWFDRY